jgi:DNA-binding NarL/FixJ family response regulator
MSDKEYFSHLYEIASHLNKEFSLHAALRKSLEKTVELLNLETGWIWLVQPGVKSVYLAASYNLPPALNDYPERLSGWCFCIQRYLSDDIEKATNISEIACTRLKNITSGTRDLKFHATIPITVNGQKAGLLNLVSKETQQLNDKQLSILNTICELIGIAIQRTRIQESYRIKSDKDTAVHEILKRVLQPRMKVLLASLADAKSLAEQKNISSTLQSIQQASDHAAELDKQVSLILQETFEYHSEKNLSASLHYPGSPLTTRELEVLALVKKGETNSQVADHLFIAERTVKFHITSILSKLDAKTRTEAVDTALKRGLISF